MPGLLDTAVTGLRVSQTALRTTGHNIANANTPGYSRQGIDIETNPAQGNGVGFIGNGARVTAIERVVDEFLVAQLRTDTSLSSELEAFNENIRQLDSLLSDPSTGLSRGLDKFFSTMENGADDPTSIPSRQLIISEAENLSQRFNTLYDSVETVSKNINQKLSVAVSQINALAENVAEINKNIAQSIGVSDQPPNDLLDKREEALRQLSQLVSIDVVDQGDGLLNVSIGSGQSLVVGGDARKLALVDGVLDPQQKEIAYQDSVGSQVISNFLNGGEVGGLLDFRESTLTASFNELGRIAIVLSDTFNDMHSKGIDLNNQFGGLFFNDVNDPTVAGTRVFGDSTNAPPSDRVMSVEINDTSQLTASNYVLEVASGDTSYRVTRETDGAVVFSGALPSSFPASIEFDGVQLNFSGGSFQAGDRFLIQPTRTGARDIGAALERPDQLAFASPVVTTNDTGNTGNAQINAGSLVSLEDVNGNALSLFSTPGQMSPPLLVQFTTPTTYDVLDNSDPANPVQLDPPIRNRTYVPGQNNSLFTQDPGASVIVANGASLGIGVAAAGPGPIAANPNGYPSEIFSVTYTDPATGGTQVQSLSTSPDDSAKSIASQLSNLSGVTANARNSMTLSGFGGLTNNTPLQLDINGVDLVEYAAGIVDGDVPNPATDPMAFNNYLADRVNADTTLSAAGIYAVAGTNAVSGNPELRIFSAQGDDFNVTLEAQGGETLNVSDYNLSAVNLTGAGAGNESTVTVGGTVDVELSSDFTLATNPVLSGLFGDSSAPGFAKSSYLGIEASINGVADTGDRFTLDFNTDGISDNRNAIDLVNLSSAEVIDDGLKTMSDSYGTLVELVGIQTNASGINLQAGQQVLNQTEDLRNSVSGVNLDEEAARLIQFEQIYNANAQVISVARDLFDRLISIF